MTRPTAQPATPSASPVVLRVDRVSKIFCEDFDLARSYAIREIFGLTRRAASALRAAEWVALRDVSFTVGCGETVLILGTRASGKTTVARLACGVLKPDAGRVELSGRAGLVGTGKVGLNAFMTVWEAAQLLTALHGVEPARADEACREILEMSDLAGLRDVRIVNLSKTALRYLSLGASLAADRDLYVFDDAITFGDSPVAQRFQPSIDEILENRTALVLASGAKQVPRRIHRVLLLHDGKIIYEGSPDTTIPIYEKLLHVLRKSEQSEGVLRRRSSRTGASLENQRPNAARAAELVRRIARRSSDSKASLALEDQIARVWQSGRPVILGPYLSDVGFEVLYWLPFLVWMKERYGAGGQPVVAISRGRVAEWYAHVASRYVDVIELVPYDTFLARNAERVRGAGGTKQLAVSAFERELLDQVSRTLDLGEAEIVHPSLVFKLVGKAARGLVPLTVLSERTRHVRLTPPALSPGAPAVPDEYIAASFWFNAYFDDQPDNRRCIQTLLREASRVLPVVLLDSAAELAGDLAAIDGGRGIIPLAVSGRGDDGLRAQADAIGRARAFVGTFGGPSLTAPLQGVPALMVHADASGFFDLHATTARQALASYGDRLSRIVRALDLDARRMAAWLDGALR